MPHLAPRRVLFQPWNWPRRLLVAIAASLPVLYFLSAVPVMRIAEEHGCSPWMARWMDSFYLPASQAAEHIAPLAAVAEWESALMDRLYGPPGVEFDGVLDLF